MPPPPHDHNEIDRSCLREMQPYISMSLQHYGLHNLCAQILVLAPLP